MQSIITTLQNLFFPPLEEFSLQASTANVLDHIRERVVTVLLRLCVLFGLISVSVGTIALWSTRDWTGILIGNIAYICIIFLAVNRKIDKKWRSAIFVLIAFAYLFLNILKGINEFSFIPLFAFVVLTTLLLGRRGGLFAFMVSIATILFANWQSSIGELNFVPQLIHFVDPFALFLSVYTDWTFYVGIFFFTIWVYFDGFNIAWKREQRATSLLAEERDRLAMAFTREQELLEEISQAHQREIELSRMKSQIITTVSHEFRTPLTVISNSVELLTRYVDNFDSTKQEIIHRRIDDSIEYLAELLQDASLVNKAYSQGFQANMVSLPLNGVGQRLKKDLLQETNDPANVFFEYDEQAETAVCLDYDFVYRAILIFLANALKYAPETSPIEVKLALEQYLTISVCDEGIGIPPEELQQIWELFYRGRNASEKRGMGLGLYVAKRLVQAMGGTVTAVSPGPNQGSTFTIQIPSKSC